MFAAAFENVPRAEDVDFVEIPPTASDARNGRHMENYIHALAGRDGLIAIADIAADRFHAEPVQLGVAAAAERPDFVTPGDELFHDVESQESARAGD
jgi:mannose/fructose-specific phosphotransferase system component IIA